MFCSWSVSQKELQMKSPMMGTFVTSLKLAIEYTDICRSLVWFTRSNFESLEKVAIWYGSE